MDNNIEKNVEQNEEIIVPEQKPEASKKAFPIWVIPLVVAVVIAIAMIIIIPNLIGNTEPVYDDYTVKVVDGVGNPVADVMVKFTYPDGEVKTRVTDKEGLAVLKNVLAQDYAVKIEQGLSDVVVDKADFTLTVDTRNITVLVHDMAKTMDIYGDIPDDSYAYSVSDGTYSIPCHANNTTYYVFMAQTTGVYKVSVTSDDTDMVVGYYGIPMFVQSTHRGEGEYDGKSFELIIQDNMTPYVIGVTATKDAIANLVIERTSDAPFDPQFAPWTIVQASGEIVKCNVPAGAVLTDLDITDSTLSITLKGDGRYYTSDGKLVYVRIGSVSSYLDVSIATIAGLVDANFGQNFGGYVYDEIGNFVGKYSYNEMLKTYYGYTDEDKVKHPGYCSGNGLYPLTEELAEAIQVHGNSTGWWNPNSANYLFASVEEITENAWLFLCCTVE